MQEKIYFYNDAGELLTGTLHVPEAPSSQGVVVAHCFTGSRHISILTQICNQLCEAGIMALRFDFSGNGQSEGDFSDTTFSKSVGEINAAAEYLRTRGPGIIHLAGHSMGAIVSLIAGAASDRVSSICCIAGRLSGVDPYFFLDASQKRELKENKAVSFVSRNRKLTLKQGFFTDALTHNTAVIIESLNKKMLIVHGEADEIIPVQEAHKAHALNPRTAELALMPGVDHMFLSKLHQRSAALLVTRWIKGLGG